MVFEREAREFSLFTFLLCHSNYKNITRITHSYRKKITRKSTLECALDYDEYLTRASHSNTGTADLHNLARAADVLGQTLRLFTAKERGIALLDEVDLLLHPLKSELNYPVGNDKVPLFLHHFDGNLRCVFDPLFRNTGRYTIEGAPPDAERDQLKQQIGEAMQRGVKKIMMMDSPHLVLLDHHYYDTTLKSLFASWILVWLRQQKPFLSLFSKLRSYQRQSVFKAMRRFLNDKLVTKIPSDPNPDVQIAGWKSSSRWVEAMSLAAKNVLQHYVVSTSLLKFPTCDEVRSKIENAAIDLMGSNESVPSVDRMKMLACSWHRVYLRYLTEYLLSKESAPITVKALKDLLQRHCGENMEIEDHWIVKNLPGAVQLLHVRHSARCALRRCECKEHSESILYARSVSSFQFVR